MIRYWFGRDITGVPQSRSRPGTTCLLEDGNVCWILIMLACGGHSLGPFPVHKMIRSVTTHVVKLHITYSCGQRSLIAELTDR